MKFYRENLVGKVAVVTGGSRGIGRAIAEGYAAQGAKVACLATNSKKLDETVNAIQQAGGEAIGIVCDVTDYDNVEAAMRKTSETFGGIDIVMINAGVDTTREYVCNDTIENWRRTIDINLIGAYYTARAAIPYLKKRGGGKIIGMGSGMDRHSTPGHSSYSASKAGLSMLIRVLAAELKEDHIACNLMYPGPTITDINQAYFDGKYGLDFFNGEWLEKPEKVVPMALFLASLPDDGTSGQLFSLTRREV